MLRLVLSAQGATHAAERSFNNHWGVPLTLARMPQDTDFAVIEIGMNHAGEIAPLAKMAELDVALITTVGAVHLAAFDSVEEIAQEKAEIFSGLKSGGVAVLNRDIDSWNFLSMRAKQTGARVISFGENKDADSHLEEREKKAGILLSFDRHVLMNIVAVQAVVKGLGADLESAFQILKKFRPLKGRGFRTTISLPNGEATLIDESYNANPLSMHATLDSLAQSNAQGKKIAIIGDMLELGEDEKTFHADIKNLLCLKKIDTIHTIGTLMKNLHNVLPEDKRGEHFADATACIARANDIIHAGDLVMIKGSFSMNLGKIINHLTNK